MFAGVLTKEPRILAGFFGVPQLFEALTDTLRLHLKMLQTPLQLEEAAATAGCLEPYRMFTSRAEHRREPAAAADVVLLEQLRPGVPGDVVAEPNPPARCIEVSNVQTESIESERLRN